MKTLFSKFYGLIIVALLYPFLLTSCADKDGTSIVYPKPSENPVYLSAEAQTKDIQVNPLFMIFSYNPEKDIITGDGTQTDTTSPWRQIQHDWVTVKCGDNVPDETIRITVTENTTADLRIYALDMSFRGEITPLVIIQNGKK
ncbi:MAG: hypothetical protein RR015_06260 [Bacteroidales bacterium]